MGQEYVPNILAQFKALLKRFQLLVDSDDATRPGETPSGTDWMSILVRFEGSYLFVGPDQNIGRHSHRVYGGGGYYTATYRQLGMDGFKVNVLYLWFRTQWRDRPPARRVPRLSWPSWVSVRSPV
jgi:hypothetical protein